MLTIMGKKIFTIYVETFCLSKSSMIFVSAEVNKAQGIKVLKDGKVVPVEKDEPIGNI